MSMATIIVTMGLSIALFIPAACAEKAEEAGGSGAFVLPPLPYAEDALEPSISARTMHYHYGQHHRGYVDKLNKLTAGTEFAGLPLEGVIRRTAGRQDVEDVFNNAAQVWNHTFFWQSMTPGGGGVPTNELDELMNESFGGMEEFRKEFIDVAVNHFASGYTWLILEGDRLKVIDTPDAETPLVSNQTPLLTIDVWEHAYYLDRQNRRREFVEAYLDNLVNWEFAAENLTAARAGRRQEALTESED